MRLDIEFYMNKCKKYGKDKGKNWEKVFTNVNGMGIMKKNYIIPSDNRLLQ